LGWISSVRDEGRSGDGEVAEDEAEDKVKLTHAQQQVLRRMGEGWLLSYADGIRHDGHYYFEGEEERVLGGTVKSLMRKKLLDWTKEGQPFWRTRYFRTQTGIDATPTSKA
jgi:hypothetical protein